MLDINSFPDSLKDEIARVREHVSSLHSELPRWNLVVWTAGNLSQSHGGVHSRR